MRYFSSVAINGNKLAVLSIDALGWESQNRAMQEADQYELLTLELLLKISQTATGTAVLRAIQAVSGSGDVLSQRIMQIQPFTELAGNKFNARAKPENTATATPKGKTFFEEDPLDPTKTIEKTGIGGGSDTNVSFTPEHFVSRSSNPLLGIANCPAGFEQDETLLHEMVHGLRHLSGLRYRRPVPKQPGYDNIEEFFAILIANIYRSEIGRKKLRLDHTLVFLDFTEDEFMKKGRNRAHLRQLRREHETLFTDLRKIDVPFNPTRRIVNI